MTKELEPLALKVLWSYQLQMKIVDEGIGSDLTEVEHRTRQGARLRPLRMRERAALVGGRVQIISSPNNGTTVEVFSVSKFVWRNTRIPRLTDFDV